MQGHTQGVCRTNSGLKKDPNIFAPWTLLTGCVLYCLLYVVLGRDDGDNYDAGVENEQKRKGNRRENVRHHKTDLSGHYP